MEITEELVNRFFSRFWGRQDVYSKRYVKKGTGEAGYYLQCNYFWSEKCPRKMGKEIECRDCGSQSWKKLDISVLKKHLEGKAADASDVVGIYPLLSDDTCRFLVFDFDDHEKDADKEEIQDTNEKWKEEVDALREICRLNGIDAWPERSRSGRGAHVWIFFQDASIARRFGFALLGKGAGSVNLKSFAYYDRMLPAQDHIPDGRKSGKPGLGNLIYVDASNLKPRIQNRIRRMAAFANPVFYKNQAMGLSNLANGRYVYLGQDENGYIGIPRGLREELVEKCEKAEIIWEVEDERVHGNEIKVEFNDQLRETQAVAAEKMLVHETGILSAATAFGKTVVCSYLIAARKVNTLILLESAFLIGRRNIFMVSPPHQLEGTVWKRLLTG